MKSKRLQIILSTTLFAILLWFYVSMNDNYQTSVVAPLGVEGLHSGLAIKSHLPETIQLRFQGDGWKLASLVFGRDLKFSIELKGASMQREVVTLNEVSDRLNLPAGLRPISMKPESLVLAFDKYSTARVKVEAQFTAIFREGYGQVGPIVVKPDSITVGGAVSLLKNLSSWKTAPIQIKDLQYPFEKKIHLLDTLRHLYSLVPDEVDISIDVQQIAEKTFAGVPIVVLSVASGREVILSPPKVDLVVRGGIEQLSVLSANDFSSSITYDRILLDTTGILSPDISYPIGVQVVARRPDRIQYIVRKKP